ncbi:signal peptide peptidase SppA [Breznakiella homolactica]|uniref:Signal peptide peptidase SppA n=1 Tax=Breznakiella homolactica TaxID=2798577 RepID=A0A7T7XPW7_9SPIR|nr:signal peptide peptidase SppA [Breznakiella homolactica]QQO10298.1 signal peptide peptidase SppA [Breznakiella homolactica]
MKKTKFRYAAVLFFFAALSVFSYDFHYFSPQEMSQLWGPTPGVRESAVSAFANPSYNGLQVPGYSDVELLYATDGYALDAMQHLGMFYNTRRLSLGLLYSSLPDAEDQLNFNIGLSFGSRAISFGLSNGSVITPSDGRFFGNYRLGALSRPMRFLSLGFSMGGTYNGDWFDMGGEVGVRPLGSNLLTLFGTYSRTFHDSDHEDFWSVGLDVKPIPGIAVRGAYSKDERISLGLSVSWEGLSISGSSVTPRNFSSVTNMVYGIGLGDYVATPSLPIPVTGSRYLELNLKGTLRTKPSYFSGGTFLVETLRVIKKAENDPDIRGIVLNTSGFSADRESLWELRRALENFKSTGKHIVAFIDEADFDIYYFASVADRIIMDSGGTLTMFGYAVGRGYFKNTLDKLGIGVTELRYLTYKSAAESYTRTDLSGADREQYNAYLDDIFGYTKTVLMRARSLSEEEFNAIINEEYLYSSRSARARGLVDGTGREEIVGSTIRELEGRPIYSYAVHGNPKTSLMADSYTSYRYDARETPEPYWGEPARIAVIHASGQTDMDRGMAARQLSRLIRDVAQRVYVRAIVIRVDSPGGSAVAADYVAEAIRDARRQVPVVVTMGSAAASGGYWVSMYADHIVAAPYTMTGSIGVIASWFYDNGLNEKLGITLDTLQRGDHADMLTGFIMPRRDLSEAEQERYRLYIMDMYDEFVGKVAAGRGMTKEAVEAIAQGRIYSGLSAVELGLADSIGGLSDAIEIARNLAGIQDGRQIVFEEYPTASLFDSIMANLVTARISLPEETPFVRDLRYRISQNGRVLPLLPLEFTLQQ